MAFRDSSDILAMFPVLSYLNVHQRKDPVFSNLHTWGKLGGANTFGGLYKHFLKLDNYFLINKFLIQPHEHHGLCYHV